MEFNMDYLHQRITVIKSVLPYVFAVLMVIISFCHYIPSTQGLLFLNQTFQTGKFTFADDNQQQQQREQQQQLQPPQAVDPSTGLTRQLITGTLTPNIVVPGVPSYCICVPAGSCPNPLPIPPNDGSGQIDIRIVNNPTIVNPTVPFACGYGLVACCQAGSYQCGRRWPSPPGSTPAAAGQAEFGEFPWQAALLTTAEVYLGSGSLISAQHVLTVAHKVYNVPITSFKVRVGEWDAAGVAEPIPAQDVAIAAVFTHPSFNPNNLHNDVAIIKLATPVSLATKSTVGTVCLPSTQFVGQRCFVAGWGKNDFGPTGAYQAIQRKVDVPLIPNTDCQNALRQTRLGAGFVLNNLSFICAGGEAGKDACTGDGGSPLVCQNNGIWYVTGMVAWGIGCATGGVPGVYVNVISFLPWIQSTLSL